MSLIKYKQKRDFKATPEPTGGKADSKQLRFVIQKHAASHLHYDFRLEMEGVLKSWAVPKGPSMDPKIKRLAMMVEDHPYDYRNFEGIIPSGYGAGTVIVWDEGFYEPAENSSTDKKTQDKNLRSMLHGGKLKFILHGKKLKGTFALVKAKDRGENGWLLMKLDDKYATEKDITLKDKSIVSGKSLEQVEKTSTNYWKSKGNSGSKNGENKKNGKAETSIQNKKIKKAVADIQDEKATTNTKEVTDILSKAKKTKFPATLKPMLATLVDKPIDEEGWMYEIKWDGYRALAFMNKGKVELKSRNDKPFNEKFYPVYEALKKWNINAVFDGEIVVTDENGIPNFGDLQNWRSEADGELFFYIFDLLWLEGKDLTSLPLSQRRAVLESVVNDEGMIRISKSVAESGIEFFEAAKKMGLEGIIAKKASSVYRPGDRTTDWLKIKANKRQEMVIGGFTKNEDSSKAFSSLLVGIPQNGGLVYTGKVGTGFNVKTQVEMMKQFKSYITKKNPFTELPDINKPSRFRPNPPKATAIFLKPELVCEVSYAEMTSDGIMRHPSFEGMREDKKAKDIVLEKEKPVSKIIKEKDSLSEKKIIVPAGKKERRTFLNPKDETQVRVINGHELKFNNLSKIYFPKEKVTKRDVLNYYYQVAPYILPYLKDRPQSMLRHPNGITGESFFYKDITGKAPGWLETYEYHSDADDRTRNYLVAKDDASLLYMASLGCIEMNPWHSTVEKEDYPDWCIIDLDPAKHPFEKVIEAALVTKEVLDGIGVPSYPKTSGSKGMHIYIPLGAKYTYEQSKEFARVIARLIHQQIPKFTSIERAVKDRSGKMYIDFLQNRAQATVSAPYSLRPKPGATVSMPLHWEEVKKGLKMTDFTIFNALERIRSEGDIFKPVIGKGIDMAKAINKFS
ncbi:MAG: ligase [Bacteroidota bacterium]|nr:ligase [Bacteroidota bacterium]